MLCEALVEMFRVNKGKDVSKGLGGRNSVGQSDPFAQPVGLVFAEVFDLGEVVHSAQGGADDHEEDFAKVVFFVMAGAGVFKNLK